jgi:hypothetical protein
MEAYGTDNTNSNECDDQRRHLTKTQISSMRIVD